MSVKAWENAGGLGGALTQEDESKQPNWYAYDLGTVSLSVSDIKLAAEELERMEIPRFESVMLRPPSYEEIARVERAMQPMIFDARTKLWRRLELGEYERSDAMARTLFLDWKETVRKRLATGLDDAPVLP